MTPYILAVGDLVTFISDKDNTVMEGTTERVTWKYAYLRWTHSNNNVAGSQVSPIPSYVCRLRRKTNYPRLFRVAPLSLGPVAGTDRTPPGSDSPASDLSHEQFLKTHFQDNKTNLL